MAKYRKIDPIIWHDAKFRALSRDAQFLFMYLLTSPHSTPWGAFTILEGYIIADTGFTTEQIKKSVSELLANRLLIVNPRLNLVCFPNWFKYNLPPNKKSAAACLNGLLSMPKCPEILEYINRSSWLREKLANGELTLSEQLEYEQDLEQEQEQEQINTLSSFGEPNDESEPKNENPDPDPDDDLPFDPAPQKPKNPNPNSKKTNPAPVKTIVEKYKSILPELPDVRMTASGGIMSDKLKEQIQARWRSKPDFQSVAFWEGFFQEIREMPFLLGNGKNGWRADLQWMTKKENFGKILSGSYRNGNSKKKHIGNTENENAGFVTADQYFERKAGRAVAGA